MTAIMTHPAAAHAARKMRSPQPEGPADGPGSRAGMGGGAMAMSVFSRSRAAAAFRRNAAGSCVRFPSRDEFDLLEPLVDLLDQLVRQRGVVEGRREFLALGRGPPQELDERFPLGPRLLLVEHAIADAADRVRRVALRVG